MKLEQIEFGRCEILDVTPDGDLPDGWLAGMELSLVNRGASVVLEANGEMLVVRTEGSAQETLQHILTQKLPRIVRLADVNPSGLRLQINSFAHSVSLELTFAVDDDLVTKAKRINSKLKGTSHCLGWLNEQCVISGKVQRCFLSSGKDAEIGEHFVVHGNSLRAHVKSVQGEDGPIWRVVKLARGKANPERHVLHLAEGSFKFVDATEAAKIRVAQRAMMEKLRTSEGSFMNLWNRYGEIEGEHILRRARRVGALHYEGFEPLEDGLVEFRLVSSSDEHHNDVLELNTEDVLEVSGKPSEMLEDPSLAWRDAIAAHRSDLDVLTLASVVAADDGIILLRPNEPGAFHPPEKGVLFLSLKGDANRLERRDKARELVWGEDARMPQLAMLLEREPVNSQATTGWRLPRKVQKRVFPKYPPTIQQLRAIQLVMESPDAIVVQGPPGTGKTTVIRAVVECLNLQGSGTSSGQILVTGFQHVAVENAIGRMLVNGLPAIKLGQRGGGLGLVEVDQRIETWRLERIAHLKEHLVEVPHAEQWFWVSQLVGSYTLSSMTPRQTVALLNKVVDVVAGLVPPAMFDELIELQDALQEEIAEYQSTDEQEFQRIVRALRTDSRTWADDGKQTTSRLLVWDRRRDVLTEKQRKALRATCTTSTPTGEQLQVVGDIRRSLLLGVARRLALSDANRPVIRADVAALLIRIRDTVELSTRSNRQDPDAITQEYARELGNDTAAVRRAVLAYTPVYAATCQQAAGKQASIAKADNLQYETVIVDEAARANPLDLLIPLSQARKRILLVGDHRQLPHMVDEAILEELAAGMDEESLVEKAERAIQDSLFERLFTDFETRPARGEPRRVITLDEQFRMHPLLGDFVSSEFYDGKVRSPRPASDFAHSLEPFAGIPAVWIDVPASRGQEERGRSKGRDSEARTIADWLPRLMMSEPGRQMTFGVITFYSRQVKLIHQALVPSGLTESDGVEGFRIAEEWRWLTRPGGETEPRLEIGTVDAFQGREFDVVFLSMVRSNTKPDNTQKERQARYGHLMSPNRMCVAMSRQKSLLIAVGDSGLFQAPNAKEAIGPMARFYDLCKGGTGYVV